ncbi:succinate dehydrogenase/fumarate reductase flavoprotein subunit [Desulfitobacterium dichloroeliminans LMG P-21439]|uniref:Succinate dehydrogenase/fumarate reductase flavoprotein subunit n=1 Tax=Desulfitobacterium dichloroeliminans (strain LMG P-21439 / DCA1) TaxID=871963 RepID=L0F3Z3_DESDL|nr:FAD-binding protein [Desulfitobacterium dichloroeliminans]AGA67897.1 succinate dehydrogenase/fumarate reductase flavoprotein subunit [Desulfitobacterium dichloroeliminans LMG P-21439]
MSTNMTRKEFIRNAALGATAVMTAGLVGCSNATSSSASKETSVPDWMPPKWDYETEILVCGYGGSGAITAIRATDNGAKVLIIEKQKQDIEGGPIHQTNSFRMSASAMMSFKTEQGAIDYLTETSFGRTPDDVIKSWAKYATRTADYLKSLGGNPRNNGDKTSEYPEELLPSARTYDQYMFANRGLEMWEVIDKACKDRNIQVVFETPAKNLIQDYDGKVVGVVATQNGQDIYIKATKAVILSTGGFEYDFEMLNQYVYCKPVRFYANPGNTGDGIRMAQIAGADLWHMYLIGGRLIPFIDELGHGVMGGTPTPSFLVNKYGKRFMRENWKSHSAVLESFVFSTDLCDFPNAPCFSLFDQSAVDAGTVVGTSMGLLKIGQYQWSKDNSAEIEKGWILKGDTIEELAGKMAADPDVGSRMDPAVLAETLATYNKYVEAGKDPDFGRSTATLKAITKAPYYALKLYPGGVNTFGGPRRNAKSQIVRPDGTEIPHLYGTGEMGSILGFLYSGGGWNICECVTSGQLAADNAVNETPWEELAKK